MTDLIFIMLYTLPWLCTTSCWIKNVLTTMAIINQPQNLFYKIEVALKVFSFYSKLPWCMAIFKKIHSVSGLLPINCLASKKNKMQSLGSFWVDGTMAFSYKINILIQYDIFKVHKQTKYLKNISGYLMPYKMQ